MPDRSLVILTMAGAAILATFGAASNIFDAARGLRTDEWVLGTAVSLTAVFALLSSAGRAGRNGVPFWCWAVSALSMAALSPMATESGRATPSASLAFAGTAIAAAMSCRSTRARAALVTAAAIGAACVCNVTAVSWPVGYVWAASCRRGGVGRGILLLLVAAGALIAGRMFSLPAFAAEPIIASVHAAHRDMIILLPVLTVGLVGYAGGRRADPALGVTGIPWLAGWTGVAIIGLILTLAGAPFDVRTCVLPFWWWMPAGLAHLARMIAAPGAQGRLLRGVGWLSCLLLAAFSAAGIGRWLDGALMAIYLRATP